MSGSLLHDDQAAIIVGDIFLQFPILVGLPDLVKKYIPPVSKDKVGIEVLSLGIASLGLDGIDQLKKLGTRLMVKE